MALLQGHLLRYKTDPEGAIRDSYLLAREKTRIPTPVAVGSGSGMGNSLNSSSKPASSKRRVLTIDQVDKMVFNPQEGWDKNVPSI